MKKIKNSVMPLALVESFTKKSEGLSLNLYRCPSNKWTIGYGRNLEDRGISKEEADLMFRNDLKSAERELQSFSVYNRLNTSRQAVLIDMCFNLGINKLLKFKKMWKALSIGDYNKAANEMINSLWYRQVGRRARTLVSIMRDGAGFDTAVTR